MGCCFANLFLLSSEEHRPMSSCMEKRELLHPFCTLLVVTNFSFILVSEGRMSSEEVGSFSLPTGVLSQKGWERFLSQCFLPPLFPCWIYMHPPVFNMSWRVCCIRTLCILLYHNTPTDPFQGWPCLLTFLLSPSTDGLPTAWSLSLQHCSSFSLSYAKSILFPLSQDFLLLLHQVASSMKTKQDSQLSVELPDWLGWLTSLETSPLPLPPE